MSDFGLVVYDKNGNKSFDATVVATRLVYSTTASANSSGNVTLPEIDGQPIIIFAFDREGNSGGYEVLAGSTHILTRSGTTITWTFRHTANYCPSVDTEILVFLYE